MYLFHSSAYPGPDREFPSMRGSQVEMLKTPLSNKSTRFGQLKTMEAPKPGGGQPCPLQKLLGRVLPPCLSPGGPRLSWVLCCFLLACLKLFMAVFPGFCLLHTFRCDSTLCSCAPLTYLFTSCLFCSAKN